MNKTLFIADLHLSEERADISKLFFDFLRHQARQAQALYILGDLFEVWIGDDNITSLTEQVATELKRLSDAGTDVYFIHGNRDFLLGKKYANKAGITLLPEQQTIELYGRTTLIMHGDSLCTLDIEYQKFRTKSRKKWWQTMILSLPLFLRRAIAKRARNKSAQANSSKSMTVMDVTPTEVVNQMQLARVDLLIHGHTHRPDIHQLEINSVPATRIVLGDWYTQGSVLTVTPHGFELTNQPFI
jgi:UDP-2,3-diacylglucosamine hydrolase